MNFTDWLHYRWRSLFGLAVGVSAWAIAHLAGLLPGAALLVAWNAGALGFLVPTLHMLLFSDAAKVRSDAGREDEGRVVIMAAIMAAVLTSLGAIVYVLQEAKGAHQTPHPDRQAWLLALCVSTLVLGWATVQALFATHYAHRYFGDRDNDGSADEGIKFPGDAPCTYRDFVYVAVCIGATCQVSDFNITHARFRNLVTAHAAIAFLFNTMVLALGINIFGNLMGQ